MPATAGRVRMPANNRVHSSAALQTHGIWQSAIGYDPYAPNKDDTKSTAQPNVSNDEPDGENAYASFQGLLALARITGSSADETRGSCSRCGRVGHLKFQCRNFLSVTEDKEREPEGIQGDVASELARLKRKIGRTSGKNVEESEESEDEDEDSESEDSDYDSEIEKIIAQKNGLKVGKKEKSKKKNDDSDDDGSDSDSGKRKKRGRSKKRRSSKRKYADDSDDSDEGRKRKRKEKRRKRDESSDEDGERRRQHRKSRKEKRRRRSHRHSDDSESDSSDDSRRHRSRRSRKAATPSDSDDDSRVGRGRKRSEKKSSKRLHKDDE
ncbi:CAX-interacting protein 4 [Pyrus x bretschneideri]|uniref:CAX-interacting protein 4 n=1 Tax=Pyrus x bretschneideri TaxID=225117 RepID=UPI0005114C74|nr:CAX-interacting protein 4 [Pyrus x bretschneideri]XP_009341409.1 CAX-interacting protein 4 [Pyrus x bretschneideri]